MPKTLLTLALLLFPFLLPAQDKAIHDIRNHYNEIKEMMKAASEEGFEGRIYLNEIRENVNGMSWRALGNYARTTQFWYDDMPGMACEEFGGDAACHLQFISVKAEIAAGGFLTEYCYQNGVLIFAYVVEEGLERRFYFHEGKVIRVQIGKEIKNPIDFEAMEDAKEQWKEGQQLRKHYLDLFG